MIDMKKAADHATQAKKLLEAVDSRVDEGPMYGSVKATSAIAHAVLAVYYSVGGR